MKAKYNDLILLWLALGAMFGTIIYAAIVGC